MRLLGRALRFLVGLIYRLIVLVLFERWIPFPDEKPAAPSPAPPTRRKRPERMRPDQTVRRPPKRREVPPPLAFLPGESQSPYEPSVFVEGGLPVRRRKADVRPARSAKGDWARLLRDKRALHDALILEAALGERRQKP